jgi:protein-disulfide isomerase
VGLDVQRFQAAMDSHAHQDAIEADMALAEQIGARGTPNSFLNGVQVTGAQPYEAFVEVMDAELAHAQRLVRAGTPQGEVYAAVTRNGLTEAPRAPEAPEPEYRAPAQPDPAAVYRVPLDGRLPQRGPSNALVTVVVFSDFQCPFCGRVEPTFTRLLDTYGRDLRVVWMNNPLAFHQNALPAAIAAMEAFEQGGDGMFWALHGKLFENSNDLTRETIERLAQEVGLDMGQLRAALDQREHEQVILAQQALAVSLGAAGTPSSFINGRNLRGAQPYEAFAAVVEEELGQGARAGGAGHAARAGVRRDHPRRRHLPADASCRRLAARASPVTKSPAANPRIELAVPRSAPFARRRRAPPWSSRRWATSSARSARACSPPSRGCMEAYEGRVRLVWRDMPLPFHPNAHMAAQAAREVFRQGGNAKFWAYQELLFAHQHDLSRETLERLAQQVRRHPHGGVRPAPSTPSATAPPWRPTRPRCRPPASRARRASRSTASTCRAPCPTSSWPPPWSAPSRPRTIGRAVLRFAPSCRRAELSRRRRRGSRQRGRAARYSSEFLAVGAGRCAPGWRSAGRRTCASCRASTSRWPFRRPSWMPLTRPSRMPSARPFSMPRWMSCSARVPIWISMEGSRFARSRACTASMSPLAVSKV